MRTKIANQLIVECALLIVNEILCDAKTTNPETRELEIIKFIPLTKRATSALTQDNKWVTAYRDKIPVREMSTHHIQCCIKCWNGQGNKRIPPGYLGGKEKWLGIFHRELINRQ